MDPILPEDTEVELKPHMAERLVAGVLTQVKLNQSVIFVNGQWAGYVGNKPNSSVNLILSGLSDEVVEVIKRKVGEIRGQQVPKVTQVTTLSDNNYQVVNEDASSDDISELDL